MTNFLLRRFVPDYQNTADPAVREKYGNLAGIVGIICNVLLFAGKLLAGTLCGSVSVTADAVNNLSDASSSLVTLLGFRLAARPADEKHPYGHARMEYLSGLAVAVMILVIGVELVKSSVQKILHPEAVEFSVLTAAVRTRVLQIMHGLDPRLSLHDFRMVSGSHHVNVIFDMVLPPEDVQTAEQLRRQIEAQLQDGKKTYHLIVTFDTAAFNELSTEAGEQQSR